MSEMEYNEGTLKFITDDIESFANEFCDDNRISIPDYYDDAFDYFVDECYEHNYIILNKKLYSIDYKHKSKPDYELPSVLRLEKNDETGEIKFATYHYDGGASLNEVLEHGMKNLKVDETDVAEDDIPF